MAAMLSSMAGESAYLGSIAGNYLPSPEVMSNRCDGWVSPGSIHIAIEQWNSCQAPWILDLDGISPCVAMWKLVVVRDQKSDIAWSGLLLLRSLQESSTYSSAG